MLSRPRLYAFVCAVAGILAFPSASHAVINATIDVDVNDQLSVVSDIALGLHTSVYANQFANANLDNRLSEAGVQMLRYPGGNYSSIYHFSDHSVDGGYAATTSSFPQFVSVMEQIGGKGMVTVNYGSAHNFSAGIGGQPKEAAAWVAYANYDYVPGQFGTPADNIVIGVDAESNNWRTAGYWARLRASTQAEYQSWATTAGVYNPAHNFLAVNHDAPVGIEYWEVGNEMYGNGYYSDIDGGWNWQTDRHSTASGGARGNDPLLSPTAYGQNFLDFYSEMKAVDPNIKVGATLTGLYEVGNVANTARNWDRNVLLQAGDTMDFANVHYYTPSDWTAQQSLDATHARVPATMADLRNKIDTFTSQDPDTFEIHFTEYGHLTGDNGLSPAIADALFVPNTAAAFLAEGVVSTHLLEMSKNLFLGDAAGLTRGPGFYGLQVLSHLAQPNSEMVDTDTSSTSVDAHAFVLPDGRVGLMLVNLASGVANDANVTVNINGSTLEIGGTKWLLGASQTTPLETSLSSGLGNNFVISVPNRSLVALLMEAAQIDGDLNDDGFVNAQDIDILWNVIRPEVAGSDDPGANDSEDLNGDGFVNEDDVDYMLANLLTAGPNRQYGDADLDGGVGGLDYTAWRQRAGTGWANGDFDGDGGVGGLDYTLWRTRPTNYPTTVGPHSGGVAAVPEPATIVLLGLAMPALISIARKRPQVIPPPKRKSSNCHPDTAVLALAHRY